MVQARPDLGGRDADTPPIIGWVRGQIDRGRRGNRRYAPLDQPADVLHMALIGDRHPGGSDHDLGTGSEDPSQRRTRSQPVLKIESVGAEFKSDPSKNSMRAVGDLVHGLFEGGPWVSGPIAFLDGSVPDDTQSVTVEFNGGARADGEHPFAVALVNQVFVTVALRDFLRERTGEVGRGKAIRQSLLHRNPGPGAGIGIYNRTHLRHPSKPSLC
ncbi:Uncharacterised protein [Mycobacteroides abscessus subsp. abscessus]|nr:Uncharacterised protein [Mycobacteroides abscessus subsp. abscessus]